MPSCCTICSTILHSRTQVRLLRQWARSCGEALYIELGEDRVQPEGCIREWEKEREWWRQRERERGREREKEAEIDGSEFSFYSSDFTMQPTPIMTTKSIGTCIIPAHVPFTSFSSYFQYRGVNFIHRSLNVTSPSSSPSPSPSPSPSFLLLLPYLSISDLNSLHCNTSHSS